MVIQLLINTARVSRTAAVITALILTIAPAAQAARHKTRHAQKHHHAKHHRAGTSARLASPAGYLLIEEDTVAGMAELPRLLMADAQADFADGNLSATYSDLRSASRALATERNSATSYAAKSYLLNAGNRVDFLGNQVKDGAVISKRALASALAEILTLRSSADRETAVAKWARLDAKGAGMSLRLAANDLQQAAQWSGTELDASALASARQIRETGRELVSGKKPSDAQVRTAMSGFGDALRRSVARLSIETGDNGTVSATTQSP